LSACSFGDFPTLRSHDSSRLKRTNVNRRWRLHGDSQMRARADARLREAAPAKLGDSECGGLKERIGRDLNRMRQPLRIGERDDAGAWTGHGQHRRRKDEGDFRPAKLAGPRASRSSSRDGGSTITSNFPRFDALSQAREPRMPEVAVRRPLDELELSYQRGLQPPASHSPSLRQSTTSVGLTEFPRCCAFASEQCHLADLLVGPVTRPPFHSSP
jgi:hypothetical protein